MKNFFISIVLLILVVLFFELKAFAQSEESKNPEDAQRLISRETVPANFRRENLVAWCIVPFDAKNQSPAERAEMLDELGLTRCAYDWREEHVPTFEDEIRAYQQRGIEFTAFWSHHEAAFELLKKYELHPQIWFTAPSPEAASQTEKVAASVAELLPVIKQCAQHGCRLGLYNHGGWGGEPENLIAVCNAIHDAGYEHVGIVYNLHHGHGHVTDFRDVLVQMKPWLMCLNLNGMVDLAEQNDGSINQSNLKIQPIGRGQFDRKIVQTIIEVGYVGPIGVIGHIEIRDVADVLRENVEGLEYLTGQRKKPDWLNKLDEADYLGKWTPKSRKNSQFAYEVEGDPDWVDNRFASMDTGPTFCNSIVLPSIAEYRSENELTNDENETPHRKINKAIAVRAADPQHVHLLFDAEQLNFVAAWRGAFIHLSDARYGLLDIPSISKIEFSAGDDLRWRSVDKGTAVPLERSQTRLIDYEHQNNGIAFHYRVAETEVFDTAMGRNSDGEITIDQLIQVGPIKQSFRVPLATGSEFKIGPDRHSAIVKEPENHHSHWHSNANFVVEEGQLFVEFPVSTDTQTSRISMTIGLERVDGEDLRIGPPELRTANWRHAIVANLSDPNAADFNAVKRFPVKRWGDPIDTRGELSTDLESAFVVDSITVPLKNQFNALMFTSGFDFLNATTAFVCTAHGDVWLVKGIDAELKHVTWQRFATGLYQPLGLKVVDGDPIVLGRDRLTRLHDRNGDGEADVYENFNDELVLTGQPHGYAMSLETDSEGNFYFIKSGSAPPHGGTMLKLSPDGKKLSVMATGYRHANGLGVSPDGLVTSADNEGNWIPSTRLDIVEPGGFYGHLPTHRRAVRPVTYDPPLCWIPRAIDNSAGGQTWVNSPHWNSLQGKMLHFSFGRCTVNVVLPQVFGDFHQAAIFRLDVPAFQSGSMRGRFNHADGHLYVCGLDGWQTAAAQDGHFQRVRATGKPFYQPTDFRVMSNGIELTLDQPLNQDSVEAIGNWEIQRWNYRWTEEYGSDHFSLVNPNEVGHDPVTIEKITLDSDQQTIRIFLADLKPVMQMSVAGKVLATDGRPVEVQLFNTINKIPDQVIPD